MSADGPGRPAPAAPSDCDVAVVGGGILGLALARELRTRRPGLALCLLEREPEVCLHQSGRSSGVIHAGIYYEPGSLKARLCVEGAQALRDFCAAHDVPIARPGKVIVATAEAELPRLEELERRAHANGVAGARIVGPEELAELEPHARGLRALHSPDTGVVDFAAVGRALAEGLRAGGAALVTGCGVEQLERRGERVHLAHPHGETRARFVVLCAGAWSDRLAVATGAPADPRIVPFRGAYLRLRPKRRELVRGLIYPVPDPALPFLGAHLTRTIDGEVLVGPTALVAASRDARRRFVARDAADSLRWPGSWRLAGRFWRTGVSEISHALSRRALVRAAARYVPELRVADVEPAFAGVRAQALARDGRLVEDFVVSESERMLHVRNAPSPGATSSLALAREIADRVERSAGESLPRGGG